MGAETHIEWCDRTFNGWIGCSKVSPGCLNCYAENRDIRFDNGIHWGKGAPRRRTGLSNWNEPVRWNQAGADGFFVEVIRDGQVVDRGDLRKLTKERKIKESDETRPVRQRVFSASLSDWLDEEVPKEWLADLLALIRATPFLDWLLLTKRPENFFDRLDAAFGHHFDHGDRNVAGWIYDWFHHGVAPKNVWIGTSAEDQTRYDERRPLLMAIPAGVRFLSCEPLLGLIDLRLPDTSLVPVPVDWVIVGGESGPEARAMELDWVTSLRHQCELASIPFLFKQWGEWCPRGQFPPESEKLYESSAPNLVTADGIKMRIGKRAAGRLLFNHTHDGYPASLI